MKRYVLLEDKRIFNGAEIVDAGNYNGKRVIHSDDKGYFLGYMEKETDNLIDLLEVGDCVELYNKNDETFIYHMSDKEAYNNAMTDINDLTEEDNIYVKAIWKRNGDIMRRYEV